MSFIAEIFFEVVIQLLAEMGAQRLSRVRSPAHPAISFVMYVVLGGFLGCLSYLFFPQLISHPYARVANLILTPLAVGLSVGAIGAWRAKRGTERVRLDKFVYGYAFALAFALARFTLGAAG